MYSSTLNSKFNKKREDLNSPTHKYFFFNIYAFGVERPYTDQLFEILVLSSGRQPRWTYRKGTCIALKSLKIYNNLIGQNWHNKTNTYIFSVHPENTPYPKKLKNWYKCSSKPVFWRLYSCVDYAISIFATSDTVWQFHEDLTSSKHPTSQRAFMNGKIVQIIYIF